MPALLVGKLDPPQGAVWPSAGYEIVISSEVDLHAMAKVEGSEKVTRNSSGDTEEDVDFDEDDNMDGDMDDVNESDNIEYKLIINESDIQMIINLA
ncbi:hypothetical protein V6N13_076987 [Hibiscus sabdariffa]